MATPPYPILVKNAIAKSRYDEILVSSHEYQPEIMRYLDTFNILKLVYAIYDTMGRSLMDVLQTFPRFVEK